MPRYVLHTVIETLSVRTTFDIRSTTVHGRSRASRCNLTVIFRHSLPVPSHPTVEIWILLPTARFMSTSGDGSALSDVAMIWIWRGCVAFVRRKKSRRGDELQTSINAHLIPSRKFLNADIPRSS